MLLLIEERLLPVQRAALLSRDSLYIFATDIQPSAFLRRVFKRAFCYGDRPRILGLCQMTPRT